MLAEDGWKKKNMHAAHCINPVINDAAKSSLDVTNFFPHSSRKLRFFSASTSRRQSLMKEVPSLTLKPLSDTCWESRIDAVKALRFNLEKVYDALYSIYIDNNRDSDTKNISNSLFVKMKSYKFICSLITWYNILLKVNSASKIMQQSSRGC